MAETKLIVTPIVLAIHHESQSPVYGENAIHVGIADEGAGPFVEIRGEHVVVDGVVRLDMDELEKVTAVAKEMLRGFSNG